MISKSLRYLPLLLLGSATPAMAAEGGLLSPEPGVIFWTVVTFVVVLIALWKFAWPHILGAVEAREQHIRDLLGAAARDRDEAAALLATQRQELEQTRARAQEILADSRTASERAHQELLAQTRREQAEMLENARRDISAEMERAREALRRDAVDVAMAAAEKLIGRSLDSDDNRRLIQNFMAETAAPRAPKARAAQTAGV
jgi:F-type H+-transporting ATPase subunit b